MTSLYNVDIVLSVIRELPLECYSRRSPDLKDSIPVIDVPRCLEIKGPSFCLRLAFLCFFNGYQSKRR
jgi:hypothetical protein